MATHKQEKVETQPQTAANEPAAESSNWLAPFSSGTFLSLQNTIGNRAVSQLLQADMAQGHQNGNGNGNGHRNGNGHKAAQLKPNATTAHIQKKETEGQGSQNTTEQATQTPEAAAPARALIVNDDARQIEPGQMRKTEFLEQLKRSVCGAAEEVLRNTMWSAMGCPYIERWFSHYAEQDGAYVERALRRYAPEASRATSAHDYIPIVTERVRRGLSQWSETGEMSGVPEEFRQGEMPGMTLQGLVSGALSTVGRAIGGAVSAIGGAISGAVSSAASGAGRAMAKARESGGERNTGDPEAVKSQLGNGHSLDGGTRQRMEKAFGTSFSGVRVHTGADAEGLSEGMNARAFTVGNDIAFGAGEYSPGTLVGDALIAHELAHTVQQGSGAATGVASKADDAQGDLEEEADVAAVGAVASAWGLTSTSKPEAGALTQLRSGLKLQRCGARQQTQTRSQTEFEQLTPYELSKVPDEEFAKAAASTQASPGKLTVSDYKRAAQFARAYLGAFKIDFDIDKDKTPRGQEPNAAQLAILNKILGEILSIDKGAVGKIVSSKEGRGGKPLPRDPSGAATLKGKVRFWPKEDLKSRGEWMAKNYQLNRAIGVAPDNLEQLVVEELARVGNDPGSKIDPLPDNSHITRQERLITIFATSAGLAAAFYLPTEDTFYLKPGVTNFDDPGVKGVARHEMGHLLGGAEKTRKAFVDKYKADYIPHWRSFEEGMAELVRRESQPAAEREALEKGKEVSENVSTGEEPFYVKSRERMEKLAATKPENRQLLFTAYFTGNITPEVFKLLETIPPPPQ
jgi:uncharacterized protein DUF4157